MSGGDKARWALTPGKEHFEPHLKNLSESFEGVKDTIYQGRNVLKRLTWGQESIIIKSFAHPNILNRYIYRWVRKSKARRAYENAIELTKLNIITPLPIGYIEYHRDNCLSQSFYIYEEWSADSTIREVITDPRFPNRAEILAGLGKFAWKLHSKRVNFKDFSPGNILIKYSEPAEFCLVDINRIKFEPLSLKKRMRTFAWLWLDDHDLLFVIAGYAKACGNSESQSLKLALHYSRQHKRQSLRKEKLKAFLGLH
jgi:tRNA A-37 threonylcarbamoyl transferase component Bud32